MRTQVTLYTVPGCPLCQKVRNWFTTHGVTFAERDVENNYGALRRMYRLTRQNLVPVVECEGEVMVRPTPEELSDMVSRLSA